MLKPGLSTIVARSGIGNTPARVHMATGRMEVNAETWWSIPAPYRQFIILHEAGHRKLATSSEFEADNYALRGMLAMGHRPDTCVDALRSVLSFTTPEHYARVRAMQGNIAPSMAVPGSTFSHPNTMYNTPSPVMESFAGTYETFIPVGEILKGAKKGVETLAAQRQAKQAAGIEVKGGILNLLDKVGQGKAAGKVLPMASNGGPKGEVAPETVGQQEDAGKSASNANKKVFMYVGIGVAVVVVIGAIAYFATR